MARVTISLTDDMKNYIDAEIQTGNYGNTSEYFRDLIRHERERRAKEKLSLLIQEGLNSGEAIEWKDDQIDKIMDCVKKKVNTKN